MRLGHDRTVAALVLAGGLPALLLAAILLWLMPWSGLVRGLLLGAAAAAWLAAARAARVRVARPLQVIANILAGLREGHFTRRAREEPGADDALGAVRHELNVLSETLREQRLGALEAGALFRRLMEEIDVAVFAFDGAGELRVANRAGERLAGQPSERLLGRSAAFLGLGPCLEGDTPRIVELPLPGTGGGRWELRRRRFRQGGLPFDLVMLADIGRVLRSEERQVWQRLVRVLSHEINNSLAPITSVAGTLTSLLDRQPRPPDCDDDLRSGLALMAGRAQALSRFMAAYARLAKLPPPAPRAVDVGNLVTRVARLETRRALRVVPGPPATVHADPDQLEQVLINLCTNAVEAVEETGGGVEVTWTAGDGHVAILVRDEGPGLGSTANLFVPFYTTKPAGSGIGLVFSRQVVEAHGGDLRLADRADTRGCEARVRLPAAPPEG
jgi:two-component system, NtrC family, nitrogen regulation sensor histidine kinase NtrY